MSSRIKYLIGKFVIIFIIVISLGFSIDWIINKSMRNEPIIVALGLISGLIGNLFKVNDYPSIRNSIEIKGKGNNVKQTSRRKGQPESISDNRIKVLGDDNDLNQKN